MSCYALNGTPSPVEGNTLVPCDLDAVNNGGHSSCCVKGDKCLTNGMCKNPKDSAQNNWYWRVGCTDKDWNDPACPKYCENIEPSRGSSLIFNCLTTNSWCCAYVGGKISQWPTRDSLNTTCCSIDDLAFNAPDPVVFATATAPSRLSTMTTGGSSRSADASRTSESASTQTTGVSEETDVRGPNVSTSASSPSSTPTTTDSTSNSNSNNPSSSSSRTLPLALGLGLTLGILLILALGAFIFIRRRKQNQQTAVAPKELDGSSVDGTKAGHYIYVEMPVKEPVWEMGMQSPRVGRREA